jgi:two-component system sensor histidine kinase KdpD
MGRTPGPSARQWLIWPAVLAAACATMLLVRARLDKAHVTLGLLLVVLGASSAGGWLVGVTIAAAAFVAFNFFFLPPYNTLVVADPLDWLVLIAFLITGVVAAHLLEQRRREADMARRRADEIDRIASLGAETLNAPRADAALDAIATVIRAATPADSCEIFLLGDDGQLRLGGRSAPRTGTGQSPLLLHTAEHRQAVLERDDGSFSVLGELFATGGDADLHEGVLTGLRALGIPLSVRGRVVGVLRLSSATPFLITREQRRVLGALSYYAALGAERVRLAEAEEEADSLRRADLLKDALLASVSHDLRTPLTAIKGIANEVWRGGDPLRAQIIEEEADRLNVLVGDLLQLSQLNAGSLRVNSALNTADDVVGAALERVEAAHGDRRFEVNVVNEGNILVGEFDFAHTMRALTNLLENAVKYSPADTPVTLNARREGGRVRFDVEDRGAGIPPEDVPTLFEPFRRGTRIADGVRGTGLGLSIARRLAEAQGGTLTYAPRPGGGSTFTLDLPAGAPPHA